MKPFNRVTEEDKQSIVKAYYEMMSLKEIEVLVDASERAVRRVLKEEGINTRLKNRYTLNEDFFERIDTEQKAYWLGFIYADGFVGNEKFNNIVVLLTEDDKGHLEKLAQAIDFTGPIRDAGKGGYAGSKNRCALNFSNPKMASDLRKLGLYPGKSMTMDCFPEMPAELTHHFIRGYFDGDGSVHTNRNTSTHKGKLYEYHVPVVSIVGTKPFIKEISEKMPYSHRIRPSKTEEMVYIEYQKRQEIPLLFKKLYEDATVYLQRKHDKFINILGPSSE